MSDPIARLNAALEGRYRIERELGEGGMATVYLADDLKHERKVALKVLKPELAAVVGAERFLAEIKTTANLQHPHILPLFDSGEASSFLFYVMPYVEGETLRDRLDREHQLPVDDAVQIAKNVAEALDYAHKHGIIHRDIKPANILLQSGKPVISDFGIALAVGVAGGGRLTETGLSLGTPHYMSPEQATGDQSVGAATDVYALGCVLYEMLVGEPPYTGSTAQAILGKIIQAEAVSATKARRSVPANVDAVVRKALEKVSADRFASAQDLARALDDPGFRYGAGEAGASAATAGRWKAVAVGLGALAAATTGIAAWSLLQPEEPGQVRRYELAFEEDVAPIPGGLIHPMPDGSGFMFIGARGHVFRSWNSLSATQVNDVGPAFFSLSPDGREIALVSTTDGMLRTAPLAGGPGRSLTAEAVLGVWDWSDDGWVYFTPLPLTFGAEMAISRVRADGSDDVETLTAAGESDVAHVFSRVLPGGRMALFIKSTGSLAGAEIWALNLETRESWLVTRGGTFQYALSGHLLYGTAEGGLMAAAFDPASGEVSGPAVPIAERLLLGAQGNVAFAVSLDGTLIYEEALGEGLTGSVEPVWVSRTGDAEVIDPAWSFEPWGMGETGVSGWALSPDGSRVAVSVRQEGVFSDIWVKQLPRGAWSPMTQTVEGLEATPFWFPDGRFVGFSAASGTDVQTQLWRRRPDGSGTAEALLRGDYPGTGYVQARVSPDEEWFVARAFVPTGPARDVVAFRADGDGTPIPLVASPAFVEQGPDLAPDGTLLAYSSDESGREEVYVRPFPDVDSGRETVSLAGGRNPKWAHNGRELFFIDGERRMNVAEIERTPTLRVTRREVLFALQPSWWGGAPGFGDGGDDLYDVDVDDQRFLMGRILGTSGAGRASRFIVVENWLEEFRDQLER